MTLGTTGAVTNLSPIRLIKLSLLNRKNKKIMTKFIKTLILSIFSLMTLADHAQAESLPAGFVYLHHVDNSIEQELLLATDDNMVGVPLDGYEGNQAICTK
jgi:uncharacterized membrane protein